MTRSRNRAARPRLDALELRALMTAGPMQASWLGQDGRDLAGPSSTLSPSDVQDIAVGLSNLPADRALTMVEMLGDGGSRWLYNGSYGPWAAALLRSQGSTSATLLVEPDRVETGRTFWVRLTFENDPPIELTMSGGTADPALRMPNSQMSLTWVGQDGSDQSGATSAVGPDGSQDAVLRLSGLSTVSAVRQISIQNAAGKMWVYGANQAGQWTADFEADRNTAGAGWLRFEPGGAVTGEGLLVEVRYENGSVDRESVIAGTYRQGLATSASTIPSLGSGISAAWLGQVGGGPALAGDVRLRVSGLPTNRSVAWARLTAPARESSWVYDPGNQLPAEDGTSPLRLTRASGSSTAELAFPPLADESGHFLTIVVGLDDGTMVWTRLAGGTADLSLRAPAPPASSIVARPGDDLHSLVTRYGTVRLSAGTYELDRPLVLPSAVKLLGDPGSVLRFTQPSNAAPWSTAIVMHAGNTTLDGFSVRFGGVVRWDQGVSFGPAVIGTTSDRDGTSGGLKVGLTLTNLDVEGPPAATDWEFAPKLMRLASGESGRIEGNRLRGGSIVVVHGPWRIAGNTYLGAMPRTQVLEVIAAHVTRDLAVVDNVVAPLPGSGKTWRFVVMTVSGDRVQVEGNEVSGLGPAPGDPIPEPNAHELILTEAYRVQFEGRPSGLGGDGWLLSIPGARGGPVTTGDVVAVLSGPAAGQWRRVAQVLNATTLLLDSPLPALGDGAVTVGRGFTNLSVSDNTIEAAKGSNATHLVLGGNQYGTVVEGNLFRGGAGVRIGSAPTESPVRWGWTHAPTLGLSVVGNQFVDTPVGLTLGTEHGAGVGASEGRVYFSAKAEWNVFVWSPPANLTPTAAETRIGMRLGDAGSMDPAENSLVLGDNRILLDPLDTRPVSGVVVAAGSVNGGDPQRGVTLVLPPLVLEAPMGLRLVQDTGAAGDKRTSNGRVGFDPAPGVIRFGYRVGTSGREVTFDASQAMSFYPEGLIEGVNTVTVWAIGPEGETGPTSSITFTLDTVAPAAPVVRLAPSSDTGVLGDRLTANRQPDFIVEGAEADAWVELWYQGRVVAARQGPGAMRPSQALTEGQALISARVVDLVGNASNRAEMAMVVDSTPPVSPGWVGLGGTNRVGWWGVIDAVAYDVVVGGVATRLGGGVTQVDVPAERDAPLQVSVRAVDQAGNVGSAAVYTVDPPRTRALWLGSDGQDRVGASNANRPDGKLDAVLSLTGLPKNRVLVGVELRDSAGRVWAWGRKGRSIRPVSVAGATTSKATVRWQSMGRAPERPKTILLRWAGGTSTTLAVETSV